MPTGQFTKVGTIVKFHGLSGALKVKLSVYLRNTHEINCFFISRDNQRLPFFIEELKPLPPKFHFLKLEEIDSKESAMELVGAELWMQNEVVDKHLDDTPIDGPFAHLAGYTLFDQNKHEIGKISDILDLPQNCLAMLFIDEREVLIPINEDLIISERTENRELVMKITDGLIDLYTS